MRLSFRDHISYSLSRANDDESGRTSSVVVSSMPSTCLSDHSLSNIPFFSGPPEGQFFCGEFGNPTTNMGDPTSVGVFPKHYRLLFYTKKTTPKSSSFHPPVDMLGATPCCLGRCAGDLKEVMGSSPFPLKAQRPRVRIPKGRKMWRFSGWWQLKHFFIFIPKFGEDEPILTNIFFKGVETTN